MDYTVTKGEKSSQRNSGVAKKMGFFCLSHTPSWRTVPGEITEFSEKKFSNSLCALWLAHEIHLEVAR
jgi:hypothetical protein